MQDGIIEGKVEVNTLSKHLLASPFAPEDERE